MKVKCREYKVFYGDSTHTIWVGLGFDADKVADKLAEAAAGRGFVSFNDVYGAWHTINPRLVRHATLYPKEYDTE